MPASSPKFLAKDSAAQLDEMILEFDRDYDQHQNNSSKNDDANTSIKGRNGPGQEHAMEHVERPDLIMCSDSQPRGHGRQLIPSRKGLHQHEQDFLLKDSQAAKCLTLTITQAPQSPSQQ